MIIELNNIKVNYEVYGGGEPIILLHGNSENYKIFDKMIEKLQKEFKVYAIDSRCHGKSEKTKEISYDLMANDVIEFIKKLKIHKPILYGFSDGGITGLLIAIKNPQLLSKLIVSGVNLNPDAISKSTLNFFKLMYFITRNKLIKMVINEPNIQLQDLRKIQIPTYILAAEKDIVKKEHTKLIADNIPNSTFYIIPNESHGSYIIHNDKIFEIIKKYI